MTELDSRTTLAKGRAVALACAGAAALSVLPAASAEAVVYATITAERASSSPSTAGATNLWERGAHFTLLRMAYGLGDKALFPAVDRTRGERSRSSVRAQIPAGAGYARSELVVVQNAPMFTQRALSYSMFIPADQGSPKGMQWWLFNQIKQTNCGVPPIAFEMVQDTPDDKLQYKVLLRNDKYGYVPSDPHGVEIFRGPLAKGRWVRFQVEYLADPAHPARNYLRLWVDGVRTGAKLPAGHAIGFTNACTDHAVPMAMNMRLGIYRGGAKWEKAGRAWFDNITYGTRIDSAAIQAARRPTYTRPG